MSDTIDANKLSATTEQTVDAIVEQSKRDIIPLRLDFLQSKDPEWGSVPGPLATFVSNQDRFGLLLYLLAVTKASSEPYDTTLPAAVWARALGIGDSKYATSRVSRAWGRLVDMNLVTRERSRRLAKVTLLREDGTGEAYSRPKSKFFKVPTTLWTAGSATRPNSPIPGRWYANLTLAELAMLLIARSMKDNFRMPTASVPDWYGISPDTAERGFTGLANRRLMNVTVRRKVAPLAPDGYTAENAYSLRTPFGPVTRGTKETP